MFFEGSKKEQMAKARAIASIKNELRLETNGNAAWGFDEPWDLFVAKAYCLNPQSYGTRIQNYVMYHTGLDSVSNSEERGDAKNKYDVNFEIKVSYKDVGSQSYNFIQIRPWQPVNGYLCIGIDPQNNYDTNYFYLTHSEMNSEVIRIGNFAHGNRANSAEYTKPEYKINLSGRDLEEWVDKHRVPNFSTLKKILVNKTPFSEEKKMYYLRTHYKKYNRKQLKSMTNNG
jgi:hypothetical protein